MSNVRLTVLQARAVKDGRVSNALFRTLAALGMYADEDGWCFPKQSTLGKDLHKSRQAINRDVKMLKELGYLEVKPQFRDDGSQRANLYRLKYDLDPLKQDVAPLKQEAQQGETSDVAPPVSEMDTPPETPEGDSNNVPYNDSKNDPREEGRKTKTSSSSSASALHEYMTNAPLFEAERMICDVSGFATIRNLPLESRLDNVYQLIQTYGKEKTLKALQKAFEKWIKGRTKDNRPYRVNNPAWIDWAVEYLATGSLGEEMPGESALEKKLSERERIIKEVARDRKR